MSLFDYERRQQSPTKSVDRSMADCIWKLNKPSTAFTCRVNRFSTLTFEIVWKNIETTLSWGETSWGEADLGRNDRNSHHEHGLPKWDCTWYLHQLPKIPCIQLLGPCPDCWLWSKQHPINSSSTSSGRRPQGLLLDDLWLIVGIDWPIHTNTLIGLNTS